MKKTVEIIAIENSMKEVYTELTERVAALEKVMNKAARVAQFKAKTAVDNAFSDCKKVLNKYNTLTAKKYYLENDLMTIVKAGKNVPAKELKTEQNENGAFTVKLDDVTVYPTCRDMVKVGALDDGIIDKIDVLRREVAYLATGAKVFLTGDVENKKDIPNETVAGIIAGDGKVSMNRAKETMAVVLHDITGGEYKKNVFSALYKDFAGYMVKRTGEWGERAMVSRAVACDLVLEYAYLYFNDMREIKYIVG